MSHRFESILILLLLIAVNASCVGLANEPQSFPEAQRNHWAFRPVVRSAIPPVNSQTLPSLNNPVDSFVVERLQSTGHTLAALPTD